MDQIEQLRQRIHQRCTVLEASPVERTELVAQWRATRDSSIPWLVREAEVSGVGAGSHLAALMGGSPRAVQVRRLQASRERTEQTRLERERWVSSLAQAETDRTQASVLEQRARNDRIAEEASVAIARATLQREREELSKRTKGRRYIDDRVAEASAEGEVRRAVYDQLRATEADLRRELEHRWVPDDRLAAEGVDNVLQARLAIVEQLSRYDVSDADELAAVAARLDAARRGEYFADDESLRYADAWASLCERRRVAELREMEFQASLDTADAQIASARDITAEALDETVIDLRESASAVGHAHTSTAVGGAARGLPAPPPPPPPGANMAPAFHTNGTGDGHLMEPAGAVSVDTLAEVEALEASIEWPAARPQLSEERRELIERVVDGLAEARTVLAELRTTPDLALTELAAEELDLRTRITDHLGLDPGPEMEQILRTPLVVPRLSEHLLADLESAVDAANHRWWQVNWCIEAYTTDRDHLDELIADSRTVVSSAERYVADLEETLLLRRNEEHAAIRAMEEAVQRVHEADLSLASATAEHDEAAAHAKRVEFDAERLLDQVVAVEQGSSPASLALAFGCDPITRSRVVDDLHQRLSALMRTDTGAGAAPLVLDDAFAFLPPADAVSILDLLEMGSDKVPVVYITDDPLVLAWGSRLAPDRGAVVAFAGV